ncbi:hypothetical protein ZYGR_0A00580 [Zygosaccharomyces rouxii]|uniref:ZYRO0A01232p n=2 Tax=Zygosaccharomyces rouxii TaxID=4956 RepID=C5DP83_ZYGRC|nr:uncharacterized protein ZYRO0A01232g [Zygosaccharomyces rouxii]KAH9198986.1 hypothetical protein LQ764DRAFT_145116 [Zygosaccharomyces rouxii]GAV46466.1 hypothetical protein ZYGR_0A00580 [Zygosaccharomyces rouxii]CAR25494.1 ZYRO0A01232p [Zygosaccharomyces rouxii]
MGSEDNSNNTIGNDSSLDLNVSLDELDLVTAWAAPNPNSLAQYVANTIDKSNSDVIVFYIDASNTFPLYQFEKLVPKDERGAKIYESIRIQIALNLSELNLIVRKILQFVSREKVARSLNKDTEQNGLKVLLILSGIEIMFKNSRMSSPQEPHHMILRDLFLRLRVEANHSNDQFGLTLKTFLIVPLQECQRCQISPGTRMPNNKRQRMTPMNVGNSVGDYIVKFYADTLIS